MAKFFEAYTFVYVSVKAMKLLTQILWLLKFLQKISFCSYLHVRSATD